MATLRQRWKEFNAFCQQRIEELNLDEDGCPRGSSGSPHQSTVDDAAATPPR